MHLFLIWQRIPPKVSCVLTRATYTRLTMMSFIMHANNVASAKASPIEYVQEEPNRQERICIKLKQTREKSSVF